MFIHSFIPDIYIAPLQETYSSEALYTCACKCAYVYVYMCACIHTYIRMCVYVCMCVCMYCMYVCMCVCMFGHSIMYVQMLTSAGHVDVLSLRKNAQRWRLKVEEILEVSRRLLNICSSTQEPFNYN